MTSTSTRCGIVAVLGAPNAGKSTLVNRLVGQKVSIVTPKVQTTRFRVRGVCMEGQAQLILVDTPGIFNAGKRFEKLLVEEAWAGASDADAILLLIDARKGLNDEALHIIERLSAQKWPMALALNKVDQVKKEALLALAE